MKKVCLEVCLRKLKARVYGLERSFGGVEEN